MGRRGPMCSSEDLECGSTVRGCSLPTSIRPGRSMPTCLGWRYLRGGRHGGLRHGGPGHDRGRRRGAREPFGPLYRALDRGPGRPCGVPAPEGARRALHRAPRAPALGRHARALHRPKREPGRRAAPAEWEAPPIPTAPKRPCPPSSPPSIAAGHMVPCEVGHSRLMMDFAGAASLSLPRGPVAATVAARSASVVPAGTFRRSGTAMLGRVGSGHRAAGSAPWTNSVPSTRMACMIAASLRATPIAARLKPARLWSRTPQALRRGHRVVRVGPMLAAS